METRDKLAAVLTAVAVAAVTVGMTRAVNGAVALIALGLMLFGVALALGLEGDEGGDNNGA